VHWVPVVFCGGSSHLCQLQDGDGTPALPLLSKGKLVTCRFVPGWEARELGLKQVGWGMEGRGAIGPQSRTTWTSIQSRALASSFPAHSMGGNM
jgi:hypothetical protein